MNITEFTFTHNYDLRPKLEEYSNLNKVFNNSWAHVYDISGKGLKEFVITENQSYSYGACNLNRTFPSSAGSDKYADYGYPIQAGQKYCLVDDGGALVGICCQNGQSILFHVTENGLISELQSEIEGLSGYIIINKYGNKRTDTMLQDGNIIYDGISMIGYGQARVINSSLPIAAGKMLTYEPFICDGRGYIIPDQYEINYKVMVDQNMQDGVYYRKVPGRRISVDGKNYFHVGGGRWVEYQNYTVEAA